MLKQFLILLLILVTLRPVEAHENDADTVKPYQEALARDPDDVESLRAVGMYFLQHDNFEEAKQCGLRLLHLSEGKSGNESEICLLYGHFFIGAATVDSDDSIESYAHLEQARLIAERLHDRVALMNIYNSLGIYSLLINSDVYAAISCYSDVLEMAKSMGDGRMCAVALSNLSGAYFMRNDSTGLNYAEEAIRIAREHDEEVPLLYGTMNALQYYLKYDSLPDRAEIELRNLEQLWPESDCNSQTDLYRFRAQLCEKKHDVPGAFRNYTLAMTHFKHASESSVIGVYLAYAHLLRLENHQEAAIRTLRQGLNYIDGSGVSIHKGQLLRELSLCYRDAGQHEKALECAFDYQDYQERRFDDMRERALQETRIKHDLYSREQQIDRQQMELLDNQFKIALLGGGVVVLVVALGMGLYLYRKKDRLYGIIVSRNRESMQREQELLQQLKALRADEGSPQVAAGLSSDKQQDLMTRFSALMEERRLFTDPSLTVAAVADELGTNRTYLSKAINESTGKTFTQVVNSYRIRQAMAEISDLEADKPLKQIAVESGFSSLSTFYVAFQSAVGMTPARYRSKLKEM